MIDNLSSFTNMDSVVITHDQDFFVLEGDYMTDDGSPEHIYAGMKRGRQDAQSSLKIRRRTLLDAKLTMKRPCGFDAALRLKRLLVPVKFISDRIRDHFTDFLPRPALRVLERDEDHGVLALFGAVRGILPHLRALEEVRVALLRLLEERLQHVHRERLAEAARTRENRNGGLLVEKPRDELRLVGRPVPGLDRGPVAVANRERRKITPALDVLFLHVRILPHRPAPRNSDRVARA